MLTVLVLAASRCWSSSSITELTSDNIKSQSFEFTFERTENWFYAVVKVTVRPKHDELSGLRDRLGGCMDRCQEPATDGFRTNEGVKFGITRVFHIDEKAMPAKEKNGSLVYTLRVPKWARKRCFYFWRSCDDMPCQDIWSVSLDSPLVRGEETPK